MNSIWIYQTVVKTLALAFCCVECHAQVCGNTEYSNTVGYVTSPGFPNAYAHQLSCIYNLRASGPTSLTIFYETIDLEVTTGCNYDWVEIWCSTDTRNKRRICQLGEERIISYASCNHAVIHFRTDESTSKKGFRFYYSFQRALSSIPPTTTTPPPPKTTTMFTTSTTELITETISTSIDDTDTDSSDIIRIIATGLGPNTSALLILVLAGILVLSLLSVVALVIILIRRSKQNNSMQDNGSYGQSSRNQPAERYSLDPVEARGGQRDGRSANDNFRATYCSDNIYDQPDDNYVQADEKHDNDDSDDYENADEIKPGTIGRC